MCVCTHVYTRTCTWAVVAFSLRVGIKGKWMTDLWEGRKFFFFEEGREREKDHWAQAKESRSPRLDPAFVL